MDFIMPLPTTEKGFDGIVVFTDPFTKAVILEPIRTTYGAIEIAEIFFKRIVSREGLPIKIISDRDPRFTGEFWKNIFRLTGTEIALSTAYHPQSDGQTERTNRTLEEVLRNQINATHDNWDTLLPMAEFAINDSISPTTGFTPFQLMYGMHPRKPIDLTAESRAPAADEFIKTMTSTIKMARENISKAQTAMKIQADKRRRDHDFHIGDKVMLNAKNLKLPSTHSRKLSPKWVGPFKIIGQKHKDSFELDLENKFNIHPVFHVSLLKPWIANDDNEFPERNQEPPPTIIINNEEEFEAEAIVKKRTRYGKTQYLVKWKGYRDEDCTWEPENNLQNAPELITEFNQKTKRNVFVISTEPDNPGRNCHKRGDEPHFGNSTPTKSKDMNQHFCNPTKTNITDKHFERFAAEATLETNIEDEANTIRRYSNKKFVQVTNDKGEQLLGYESPTMCIYYYRPGMMVFTAMHTSACDCNMCEWIYKPAKPKSPRHEPYQYGRRTHNNRDTPRSPSPINIGRPPFAPSPIAAVRSPSPPSWTPNEEDTDWNYLANNCNWTEDPFKAEEESPKPTTPKHTAKYWRDKHYQIASRIVKMNLLRLKICPGIPMYNGQRGIAKAEAAYHKIHRAEDILQRAFNGIIPYGTAHREWSFYLRKCSHGINFYSPSQECARCDMVETELNQVYEDGWTHIKKESTA
jgi:hypothetical protein